MSSGSTRSLSIHRDSSMSRRCSSHFLGYIPTTSGVIEAAIRICIGWVESSILRTASLRMDAVTGSM